MSTTEKNLPEGENTVVEAIENNEAVSTQNEVVDEPKKTPTAKKNTDKKSIGGTELSRLWPKIICILAAFLVWFYAAGEKSIIYEKEFYNISVDFESLSELEKQGYTIVHGDDVSLSVTVNGVRSEVNDIKLEDIKARCDVSGIYGSGEFTLPIVCDSPGNTSVASFYPSAVTIYVDKTSQKSIPVTAEIIKGGTTDLSIKIEQLEPSVSSVKITGPAEEIEKISHAAIDISLDNLIDRSTEWTGELYLVDKDGNRYSNAYVRLDRTSVKVLVPVNKYKTVPITIVYDGLNAQELGHEVNLSQSFVEIRGSKDIIDGISTIYTEAVDISDIGGETKLSAELSVPPGVEITEGYTSTFEINVVPHNNNQKTITTQNIVMINVPEGMTATLEVPYVTVDFYGTTEAISRITPENVYAVADLVNCAGHGEYKVALTISYPDIDGIKLSEGKKYTAQITIN